MTGEPPPLMLHGRTHVLARHSAGAALPGVAPLRGVRHLCSGGLPLRTGATPPVTKGREASRRQFCYGLWVLASWACCGLAMAGGPDRMDLFTSGTGGYHTYRIPALLATPGGTLLAFCEGRKNSPADDGDIDLLLRRSIDGGRTWEPPQLVYEEGGEAPVTIGNPCPVVDARTQTIWLACCRNNRDVLFLSSTDEGRTWRGPVDVTSSVKRPEWGWYATGPGIGIQLKRGPHAGRLVIPCDHGEQQDGRRVMYSHAIFSDDGGRTWQVGESVAPHTDECQVVERTDGTLLINMRNYWGRDGGRPERGGRRALARSRDGGATWSDLAFDATLIEPMCQASLISVERPDGSLVLYFANPASSNTRHRLTLRASLDEGATWPIERLIDEGPAAYSALAWLGENRLGLLYERDDYRHLTYLVVSLREE